MVLQKAMKQGRNVHGIPLLDACSDHNITSRMCGHVGGHAYSVSVLKWLLDWHIQYPIANLRHFSRVHIWGWECSIQQNMLASWRLYSHSLLIIHLVSPSQQSAPHSIKNNGGVARAERRDGVGMPLNVATHP